MKKILFNEFEYYGQRATDAQLSAWALDLADIPTDEVYAALIKLRRETGRTRPPLPNQIRDVIFKYETSEQAWATVPHDVDDESRSYVMTNEARLAWGKTIPLLRSGNIVQAFLAFKDFYKEEVERSKAASVKQSYEVMFGTCKLDRDEKIRLAYEQNKITKELAFKYNPYIELPNVKNKALQQSEKLKLEYKKPVEEEIVLDEATRAQRQKDIQNLIANLGKQIT